jgi:O-acetylhomoserine/O-acetylserine sulfhydrylase-like pyridoxal-dependent enzyme
MSKKQPEPLQTIDPTALAQVSGGAGAPAASSGNEAVMTALTGILDSIKSLAGSQSQGGFGPTEMMLMMMMMQQGHGRGGAQVVAQQPNNWTYDASNGYWIVK